MTPATAPPWPGSRVLLGWWRQLAPRQPRQLFFARLLLHRVEALVRVARPRRLDPWQRALLRLVHARAPGGDLETALTDLHMDRQVLTRFVHELTGAGLVHLNGTGVWRLTTVGRRALETGELASSEEERRTFYFLDNSSVGQPPHLLPLRAAPDAAPPPPLECPFDLACLEACLGQSPQWKAHYGFPADVEAFSPPRPAAPPETNWRRVVLDSLESMALALVPTIQSGAAVLLGFPVRTEGWALEATPVLELASGWEEVLPDLTQEPPPEAWRQAWHAWCQPRSLPLAEVDACRLERVEYRLLVHAPPRLIERLRTARSDAIKHEAWLLAGSGRLRLAAQVELLAL
jgi:hypothetical protein